jgi:hypothetical protein
VSSYASFFSDGSTTTTAILASPDTSIAVVSTTSFPSNGFVLIDAEVIEYASKTATTFDGITRAMLGSQKVTHVSGSVVTIVQTSTLNVSKMVEFSGTSVSNGGVVKSVVDSTFVVQVPGTYNIQFSVQGGCAETSQIFGTWLYIGQPPLCNNLAESARYTSVPGKHTSGLKEVPGISTVTSSYIVSFSASDVFHLRWAPTTEKASATDVAFLTSFEKTTTVPLGPAAILTIFKISD